MRESCLVYCYSGIQSLFEVVLLYTFYTSMQYVGWPELGGEGEGERILLSGDHMIFRGSVVANRVQRGAMKKLIANWLSVRMESSAKSYCDATKIPRPSPPPAPPPPPIKQTNKIKQNKTRRYIMTRLWMDQNCKIFTIIYCWPESRILQIISSVGISFCLETYFLKPHFKPFTKFTFVEKYDAIRWSQNTTTACKVWKTAQNCWPCVSETWHNPTLKKECSLLMSDY